MKFLEKSDKKKAEVLKDFGELKINLDNKFNIHHDIIKKLINAGKLQEKLNVSIQKKNKLLRIFFIFLFFSFSVFSNS